MTQIAKVLYTAKTRTMGGRGDGASRSSDGLLDIWLSTPGSERIGTNPEQLFAAGWSASIASAIAFAAQGREIALLPNVSIDAEIDLCLGDKGRSLRARFNINLSGMEQDSAWALVNEAVDSCPYCQATQGNVDIVIRLTHT